MGSMKKAVVLLSGGIDSAVALYIARRDHECHTLTFNYGQRLSREVACAGKIAGSAGAGNHVLDISLPWKGSSLLDENMAVPDYSADGGGAIPATYVPARNIIFLSFAASFAEAIGADAVFIGAHQLDYSNYPDCRSEFFESFGETLRKGTRAGAEGKAVRIITPLLNMGKKDIIRKGMELKVPLGYTWSCYKGEERPCMVCESCAFRANAFKELGIKDPAL